MGSQASQPACFKFYKKCSLKRKQGEQRKTHPDIILRTVMNNGTEPKCVRDRKKQGERGPSLPTIPIPTALKGAYSEKTSPPDVSLERIRPFTLIPYTFCLAILSTLDSGFGPCCSPFSQQRSAKTSCTMSACCLYK